MDEDIMPAPEYARDQSDEDLDTMLAALEDRLLTVIESRLDLSAGLAEIIGAPPQPTAKDGDELAVGGTGEIVRAATARKSAQRGDGRSGCRSTGFSTGDTAVVAAIAAGDPAGLAEAYDRYAGPLYSFCLTILHEPADAADVVQDTFVIAVPRMSSLRDPERLRPWLYTVARNECLRRRRRGLSLQARLEEAPEVTDEAAGVEQAELRALVRQALLGVGPAEQEVLELQLRHGLAGSEVASVLGVSRNHAHALMSRARGQLETALGALMVARTGRRDCPELDALLGGWDGRLTVLLRKRVNRHVERCAICSRRRERELTPSMLLGVAPVLALPLAAAAPGALRDQVMRAGFGNSPTAVAHRAAAGQTLYSFGHHGFPKPVHPRRTPWRQAGPMQFGTTVGTAAIAVVSMTPVIAAAVALAAVPPHHHPGGQHAKGELSAVVRDTSPPTANAGTPLTTIGTLTVSPAALDITSPGSGTITLTASGGQVDWKVIEPPWLEKEVVVAPRSGTLAAGATTKLTISVNDPGEPRLHLIISRDGSTVIVEIS